MPCGKARGLEHVQRDARVQHNDCRAAAHADPRAGPAASSRWSARTSLAETFTWAAAPGLQKVSLMRAACGGLRLRRRLPAALVEEMTNDSAKRLKNIESMLLTFLSYFLFHGLFFVVFSAQSYWFYEEN